jgi:broad specificity phosphatase PhoE
VSIPGLLRRPRSWWYFRNVFKPTWGEPYREIVARMRLAMKDAVEAAAGHEAVIVSHQLPIWMARSDAEGRRLFHDPRKRECTLASVTSFSYVGYRVTSVSYREPAAELLRAHQGKKFVAGA